MSTDELFHSGEIALQTRAGVRDAVAARSQTAFRRFMPDQHRDFFTSLPFLVAGVVDARGQAWATLLIGNAGFVQSPTATSLLLSPAPVVAPALTEGLRMGAAIGLLGIEPGTRRRNRANGVISAQHDSDLRVIVHESFGNCPKYIQARELRLRSTVPAPVLDELPELNEEAKGLIQSANTFFVASYVDDATPRRVDVSHRGGAPGFVRVGADGRLWVPEFIGNHLFCTLGNFLRNPRAGLVFADFASGDLLHLSGTVELLWEGGAVDDYAGAVHAWSFQFGSGFWLRNTLPFTADAEQYSPFLQGKGPWVTGHK